MDTTPITLTTRRRKLRPGAVGGKKIKTGCLTCKIRHKKCDEKRPSCTPCTTTDRACDFLSPSTPATHIPKYNQIFKIAHQIHSNLQSMPLLQECDKQHFEWFRQHTTAEFALYFNNNDDFWISTLLQAAQTEPFILHAVLSLSAFGQAVYHSPDTSPPPSGIAKPRLTSYAVHQYNLALGLLRSRIDDSTHSLEHTVLGTLIFVAIEMMWCRVPRIQGLLDSSCRMLRQHPKSVQLFPSTNDGNVTWADLRLDDKGFSGGSTDLKILLAGLAHTASQVSWFTSYAGETAGSAGGLPEYNL